MFRLGGVDGGWGRGRGRKLGLNGRDGWIGTVMNFSFFSFLAAVRASEVLVEMKAGGGARGYFGRRRHGINLGAMRVHTQVVFLA